jgi:hypothetical protein
MQTDPAYFLLPSARAPPYLNVASPNETIWKPEQSLRIMLAGARSQTRGAFDCLGIALLLHVNRRM